jgi:hypothetical protein
MAGTPCSRVLVDNPQLVAQFVALFDVVGKMLAQKRAAVTNGLTESLGRTPAANALDCGAMDFVPDFLIEFRPDGFIT